MADTKITYLGLELKNPIIVSSSGLTKDLARLQKCAEAGCGAAVMKSLFEAEVARNDPTPCYKIIRRDGATIFYSYEQASPWDPERYADELRRAGDELDIPIIPSINCVTLDGWRDYAGRMQDSGAPALELNVSCPYGSLTSSGENPETAMLKAVEAACGAVSMPIAVKLPARLTSPERIIAELQSIGVRGVVLFNRFAGLDIDIYREMPIMHGGWAGHGGPFSIHHPLFWISRLSPHTTLDIAASGGVTSADDVVKYLLAGADAVQVCTAVYLKGYDIISELLNGLILWMDSKSYSTIDAFRGNVSGDAIADMHSIDRTRKVRFEIDPVACISCDLCRMRCLHDAITAENGMYDIIQQRCVSCGFCAEICPVAAVNMFPIEGS